MNIEQAQIQVGRFSLPAPFPRHTSYQVKTYCLVLRETSTQNKPSEITLERVGFILINTKSKSIIILKNNIQ